MYSNKLPKDNKLTLGLFVCHIANLFTYCYFHQKDEMPIKAQ